HRVAPGTIRPEKPPRAAFAASHSSCKATWSAANALTERRRRWIQPPKQKNWTVLDSNQWPPLCQSGALPTAPTVLKECILARLKRVRKPRNKQAAPRFELGNRGFADLRLTTWLCRHSHRLSGGA